MVLKKSSDMYKTLDKCPPLKKKYTYGNNMPFMDRALTNAHKKWTFSRNQPIFEEK